MTWDELQEIGPLYALGAVDEETARGIEDFLQEATPEQQREISELREVAALIPLALPLATVPEILRDRLFVRISAEEEQTTTAGVQPELATGVQADAATTEPVEETGRVLAFTHAPRREASSTRWLLLAATFLLTFTSGYLLWRNNQLQNENNMLALENVRVKDENDRVRDEVREIVSPATKIVAMAGQESPEASAKVVWDTNRQTWVIYIFNLPPPPTDKQYQLWYVKKDAKISAAVFDTNPLGETVLKLDLPADVTSGLAATAVTLEPRGGSKQPTSKLYLVGAI
jgi:Anti-sigma-K factor rskA